MGKRAPRKAVKDDGSLRTQLLAQLINALVRVGLDHLLKHFGL